MKPLVALAFLLPAVAVVAAPVPKEHPWVTVRGRVIWPKDQDVPEAKLVPVNRDKEACCAGTLRSDELLIDPKSRGVRNVIVWLRPDTKEWEDPFPKDRIHPDLAKPKPVKHVIKMETCQFVPRAFAARDGDTWAFENKDAVVHIAHVDHQDPLFNRIVPAEKTITPDDPLRAHRVPLLYKCDIHPWMKGVGRVFDHPYFAVTDKDGQFELKGVPKGDWRIVYYHERGFHKGADGRLGFPVKVRGNSDKVELKDLELVLPSQ